MFSGSLSSWTDKENMSKGLIIAELIFTLFILSVLALVIDNLISKQSLIKDKREPKEEAILDLS